MSDQWYYRLFGEEFGPVPLVELKRVVQNGLISAEDEVRLESETAWKMASRVQELRAEMNAPRSLPENKPPTATDQWMCRIGDMELGPFPFEELIDLAKSGQLLANDGVKHGANGSWFETSMISRLMAAISSASSNDQPERASVRSEPSSTGASAQWHSLWFFRWRLFVLIGLLFHELRRFWAAGMSSTRITSAGAVWQLVP